MSLMVKLNQFRTLKSKSEKYARLEFRGQSKFTDILSDSDELIEVNQVFQWTVKAGEAVVSGDTLQVQLVMRNRWGHNNVVGVYTLGMHVLVAEGYIKVTDSLIDDKNRSVPAYVDMDVYYIAPPGAPIPSGVSGRGGTRVEDAASETCAEQPPPPPARVAQTRAAPPSSAPASAHISRHNSAQSSDVDSEGEDNLERIGRHIANYERSVSGGRRRSLSAGSELPPPPCAGGAAGEVRGAESAATSRAKRSSKGFLKRGFSMGEAQKSPPAAGERKRHSTLRTVRNLMRLGRQRAASAGDEGRALVGACADAARDADAPASPDPVPAVVAATDCTSESDAAASRDQRPTSAEHKANTNRGKGSAPPPVTVPGYGASLLKAADFQVCVSVIEARQLAGLNMDPVVSVQVGDARKYTSVKESTNCPYYNEYFVFDFHMPPIMLFDKIIVLSVLQSRNILRPNKLLGTFKLDVATVWSQPDRQFYHKWAVLTDPDDFGGDIKGYVKCDISIIGKGDTVKIPPKSEKDDDDIEANLLLPDGVPVERQRARFVVKVYRADGLPKMNNSLLANVKRALTGEARDLVDPQVLVSFAGMTGATSVKKGSYAPVWNEQIVFTEMFPPLCQRIKLQLRDNDPVRPTVIGTHFIDLNTISDDGEKGRNIGFLPTFGPAFIHLYGSTRDYSLLNQQANLNAGMGEGVSYRARLLVAIRTEITDNMETHASEVEVEPAAPIHEASYGQNEEFFLFASLFECNMIDKKLTEKPISFELSIGNAGNTLDGSNESLKRPEDLAREELEAVTVETGYWQSTVRHCHAHSGDNTYFYLPCFEHKPCMQVRTVWPDNRRRMYNSNIIARIVEVFEEGLAEAHAALEGGAGAAAAVGALKGTLEAAGAACLGYATLMPPCSVTGNTKLDRERTKMCQRDIVSSVRPNEADLHFLQNQAMLLDSLAISQESYFWEQIAQMTRTLKALVTKHSIKDRLRTAYSHLNRLKELCEDPQHSLPDVFLWMISNGKRLAYARVPARHLIYSDSPNERGMLCGKMQTLFLKWPGKKADGPSGWAIPGKVYIYMWLGVLSDKKHFIEGLPQGYEISSELRNADNPLFNAPKSIFYAEKHNFQLRAYVYQARSLIGSDASGLSDPFARVICGESSATTQVIDETLSPTWDELLVLNEILLYSTIEQIKSDPPLIVIEVFDQDKVGKSEFIGRTTAKPHVKAFEDPYERPNFPPSLEWHELTRGGENAGELLAAFELLEMPGLNDNFLLPELPSPRTPTEKSLADDITGPILPVPRGIRPTLSTYRIEVLFWGLRDLKRIHLMTVDRPRVDIECAGNIISSALIQNTKRNPNFTSPVKFVDVELPDQELYRPPLTIRVIDCRSFGRATLVGTHTINSIHKYMYTPMSKREKDAEDRNKSVIQLQHLDFKRNIFGDQNTDSSYLENIPLLPRGNRASTSYGSGSQGQPRPRYVPKTKDGKHRKESMASFVEDDERSKDWWTKYFASVEYMIEEEKQAKQERMIYLKPQTGQQISPRNDTQSRVTSPRGKREKAPPKSKPNQSTSKKMEVPISSLVTIYPHELEATPEYDEFKEWLQSFDLYRGKKTGDESDDENRVVGVFKGAVKVYKWPIPKGIDDHTIMGFDPNYGFFQGLPSNEPIHVLVRVYIVKATDLHPMDLNGKADPYIVLHLGSKRISDKENYVSKQLNPVFGKCFEVEASFPQDSMLTIQVLDWDLFGSDDLIGETKIDLENRFYSRHRATCGLPRKYEESGYNRWRDSMKPTQILAKLCKDGKVESPVFTFGKVKIGRTIFHMPIMNENGQEMCSLSEEDKALVALRQWHEFPRIGTHLVTEHVETRPLYNPNKPGIEQGRLEMWVDMFPMDMPLPGAPLDISPRKPQHFELRVIVWNTDDVVLEDDEFFTGEKMSDIYVKGWVKGPEDCQSTDIHYRSLTGEGNFNWRFVYPFEYLEAEEKIVISRKESMFSWDQSECKIPARLELQVWDADHFSADDFLGAMTLDLNRFPRGAKSSQLCTLDMLRNDGTVPMVNIFKQKRVKGWWPFYIKREAEQMVLTGKVEAEIHLLTREEADKVPAGLGRNEPDPLDKPNRPDASFMWFLNPLKSVRYIVWHNYKWTILKALLILGLAVLLLLFFYAIPGYSVKKLLGA